MPLASTAISRVLVIGQFASIAVLLFGGGWQLPPWSWTLFALGILIFTWACISLGPGNFTIMPEPRQGNEISRRGIYRFIRHPMYTSVLLCGIAVTLGAPSVAREVALSVCTIVLILKVRHEERLLAAVHPDYPNVMRGTARLLPWVL